MKDTSTVNSSTIRPSGGNAWGHGEAGHGTGINTKQPRADEPLPGQQPKHDERPSPAHGEIVLLVEDNDMLRDISREMITDLGYRVHTANNAEQALDLVEQQRLRPEILFTDVVLPDIDGRQLAERITARHPDLKVIYTSGYSAEVIMQHGVPDKGIAFIQKPFSHEQLAEKIREVLDAG